MKKRLGTTTLAALILLCGTTALYAAAAPEPEAALPGVSTGERFELLLQPGEHYSKRVNYIVYRYTVWPQVAVWLETPDGTYIETLYVTRVVVDQDFNAAPEEGRPEALPVWSHLVAEKRPVDAVTSPTTVDNDVSFGNAIAAELPDGDYVVRLETNRSYDWNDTYTKKNAGVNGQPSLVYSAPITVGGDDMIVDFVPVGTGSVDGSDGRIRTDLSGMDTAFALFSSMRVAYRSR